MDVVLVPDRRSPIVAHMVWYRNGATDDPLGKSGIAHFLEHLMFKGTERYGHGHFSDLLSSVGGNENASTSWEFTHYVQRVPKEALETCMIYEADRMTNLLLSAPVLAMERDVVLSERGMIADSRPPELLREALHAAAFPSHPCGRPIIGWRHEIETLNLDDATAYYRRFYTPENAILVVAGDIEPQAVLDLADRIYGAVRPTGAALDRLVVSDPPARTRTVLTLSDPTVRQPLLKKAHVVPSIAAADHADAAALEVLACLLGGEETSLLHRRLVLETRQATAMSAGYWGTVFRNRTLFNIDASPASGVSLESLDAAVDDVIATVQTDGFSQDDIARAKMQLVTRAIFDRDSHATLAYIYGLVLSIGLPFSTVATWPARIEAVTNDDLRRVAGMLDRQTGLSGHLTGAPHAG
ncbi:zinc protease [Rhizobium sp. Leaf341]|nr:zinc protease [Rhizobium sp. Leaf341]